jgi:hypothetical protein
LTPALLAGRGRLSALLEALLVAAAGLAQFCWVEMLGLKPSNGFRLTCNEESSPPSNFDTYTCITEPVCNARRSVGDKNLVDMDAFRVLLPSRTCYIATTTILQVLREGQSRYMPKMSILDCSSYQEGY